MTETRAPRRRYRGPLAVGNMANAVIVIILGIFTLSCVLPILLIYISSFTAESAITRNGFSFFPEEWSLSAYAMLFGQSLRQITTSYANTIALTVLGTVLSLLIFTMYAFAISRKDFKLRQALTFFAYFTMLFNGGMVSSYIVKSNVFGLRNTFWVLLLPEPVRGL